MKYTYSILLIFTLIGCSNIKTITDNSSLNRDDKTIQYILKKNLAEDSNKNILYFTSGFDNESIEVKSGNDIVYTGKATTIDQLSLAYVQVVSNDKPVTVKLNNTALSLNHENLNKYKFIYILKMLNIDKYLVEYSNKNKNFK
jgi:uncharacterized protein